MKIRTLVSSLALVSALAISGPSVAQSMVGDVAIPGERIEDFQEKCRAIASAQNESLSAPVNDEVDEDETGSVDQPADTDSPDYANDDNIDQLLASMTPEQCQEAGLVDGQLPTTAN